ncbi:MAG TPA: glycosyltransferase family 2 protein [Cellvibrionaceae bacterium]
MILNPFRFLKKAEVSPLATVIIPTFNRAGTLPLAIKSALNQSIYDIEVLIVGDGCSDECRQVARDFESVDGRVKFYDMEKAPLRGLANRDMAVRRARGQYIFYSDDDDLLLPHHVETLSKILEYCDVVDTPVASVSTSGRIDLGLHDSGSNLQRSLLSKGVLKMVFDTHLAHRKDAYLALGAPWLSGKDRRAVLHFLGVFAKSRQIKWITINRITALSFHGMARVAMSDSRRVSELAAWSDKIQDGDIEQKIRQQGSYAFHFKRLIDGLYQAGISKNRRENFLGKLIRKINSDAELTDAQKQEISILLAMTSAECPPQDGVGSVFLGLLDARLGPRFPTKGIVDFFLVHFSRSTLEQYLDGDQSHVASVLASIYLRICKEKLAPGVTSHIMQVIRSASVSDNFFVGQALVDFLESMGHTQEAWECAEFITYLAPDTYHASEFWKCRKRLAETLGLQGEVIRSENCLNLIQSSMT